MPFLVLSRKKMTCRKCLEFDKKIAAALRKHFGLTGKPVRIELKPGFMQPELVRWDDHTKRDGSLRLRPIKKDGIKAGIGWLIENVLVHMEY